MDKEMAQICIDAIVDGLRTKRSFLVFDSKTNGTSIHFICCKINNVGGACKYHALMNYLGFRAWTQAGVQQGNIAYHPYGNYSDFIWNKIFRKAKEKGLSVPPDFQDLISEVAYF